METAQTHSESQLQGNHTWTFHIHKVRVRTLNKTLLLVSPLLLLRGWVQQVFCELGVFTWETEKTSRYSNQEKTIKPKKISETQFAQVVYDMARKSTIHRCPKNRFNYFTDPWRIDAAPRAYINLDRKLATYLDLASFDTVIYLYI